MSILWSCGGGCGAGNATINSIVPIASLQHVDGRGEDNYKSVTCAATSSFMVDTSGLVYTMGSGFLGVKTSSSQVSSPIRVAPEIFNGGSSENRCRAVYSNSHHDQNFTFFLAENGALYSLGNSNDFRTGVGTEIPLESIRMMGGFDTSVEVVAIGVSHGVAITASRSIFMWGRPLGFGGDAYPTPTLFDFKNSPDFFDPFIQVQAGEGYTLFLTKSGKLFAYGDYASTCLGSRDTQTPEEANDKSKLIELDWGFGPLKQIACGYTHALALTEDGRVIAWGSNKNGSLGVSENSYDRVQVTPSYINTLPKVIYIHSNHYQSFVICINGDVYSWGYNVKGSLGTKLTRNYIEPEKVYQLAPLETNGLKINQMSICENYSLFLMSQNEEGKIPIASGNIEILGDSTKLYPDIPSSFVRQDVTSAQLWSTGSILGTNNEPDDNMVVFRPVKSVQAHGPPVCVAVGNRCSYVSFQDGSMYDWGNGFALGHGVDEPCREPSKLYDLDHVKIVQIVSNEEDSAVALTENGKLYGWGRATNHLNGTGSDSDTHHPRLLEGFRAPILKVSMSSTHCLAVDSEGSVYAWGVGKALGNRNRSSMEKGPKKIQDQTFYAIDVAAGTNFSMMLSDSGHILTWGEGVQGQLGLGTNNKFSSLPTLIKDIPDRFVSIAAGPDYATAVSSNGQLYMWGSRESGLLSSIPMDNSPNNNKDGLCVPCAIPRRVFGESNIRVCVPKATNCFAQSDKGALFAWGQPHTGIGTGLPINVPTRVESTQGVSVINLWGSGWQTLAIVAPIGTEPVVPGIKNPIKEQATIISPPSTPNILQLNSEMLGKKNVEGADASALAPSVQDISAHEDYMKALTDEVRFWKLVDTDMDIATWCGRVPEVKEFLNRQEAVHYAPNIAQSIQHSQKNIPAGERVIKGWVMYSINFKDYESDRIVLITTEAIHRIKYDWINLTVIHDKKFPLSSIYKVKIGRFGELNKTISSSLRGKVYDQQVGIQVWFENPSTWKPPSFVQPFAKKKAPPYITLRPALALASSSIEEQMLVCSEIGTAIQCSIHYQRNGNRPIEFLHRFARESPAKNNELAAFPVRKVDTLQRFSGNGLLAFAHNKFLKKTQKGFVDPATLQPNAGTTSTTTANSTNKK